jgi:hypothetical protein
VVAGRRRRSLGVVTTIKLTTGGAGNALLPVFARYPLDEIDPVLCQECSAGRLGEAAEIREALKAGADLRDERNRPVRPLGPASIRKLIDCPASILDEAVEDGHIDRSPASGRRMRIRVSKPPRLPRDGRSGGRPPTQPRLDLPKARPVERNSVAPLFVAVGDGWRSRALWRRRLNLHHESLHWSWLWSSPL